MVAKVRARPRGILEAEISADAAASFGHRRVAVKIHDRVFHRPPKALKEDVVAPAAFAIHANSDLLPLKYARGPCAGELASLVGVQDLGFPKRVSASSNASTRKSVASLSDTRHANTRLLNDSTMAPR
jgi:hypothetical protein